MAVDLGVLRPITCFDGLEVVSYHGVSMAVVSIRIQLSENVKSFKVPQIQKLLKAKRNAKTIFSESPADQKVSED